MNQILTDLLRGSGARLTSYVRWTVFNTLGAAIGILVYAGGHNPDWTVLGAVGGMSIMSLFLIGPVAMLTALLFVLLGGLK